MSKYPVVAGMGQFIVKNEEVESVPMSIEDALSKSSVKLSEQMRNKMKHQGLIENEESWKTETTYEDVGGTMQTVYPEEPPTFKIADMDDGIVITDPGTFVDGVYQNDYTSSSVNDGLVSGIPAIMADNQLKLIDDMPGSHLEIPATDENSLTFPGLPIKTSETTKHAVNLINAAAVDSDATSVTLDLLRQAGASSVEDRLTEYKSAIESSDSLATIYSIQLLVAQVNDA